jgi:uncharacterized protein YbjT (DUF2867 family)
MSPQPQTILVTGVTGYIGSLLTPELIARGHAVRCMARDPERVRDRGWRAEIVKGDALKPDTLGAALQGVDAAYYLIHSMAGGEAKFEERDRLAARNFGAAAKKAGVKRIVYLGGLGADEDALSPHLKSRHETGACLREAGVPVTEFRAGMIVGSGSLSFELLRYLTERLPVMLTPTWVRTLGQPIAVGDVLRYLADCLDIGETAGRTLEICGPDVLSYQQMIQIYAEERGLHRRRFLSVPVLTPRIYSYLVHFVTPIPNSIARPLVLGLRNKVVCRDDSARRLFPFAPMPAREAVRSALEGLVRGNVLSSWSDAYSTNRYYRPQALSRTVTEGMVLERQRAEAHATPAAAFAAVTGLGGKTGWLYANFLWRIRGFLDRLVGGVGLQRGRRDGQALRVGDSLDFWRVESLEKNRLLRLHAEMLVPGQAWLEFVIADSKPGSVLITQTAYYSPRGLFGHLYWWSMYPAHKLIFPGMLRALVKKAEAYG